MNVKKRTSFEGNPVAGRKIVGNTLHFLCPYNCIIVEIRIDLVDLDIYLFV